MSSTTPTDVECQVLRQPACNIESAIALPDDYYRDLLCNGWPPIFTGIILAGAAYPTVAGGLILVGEIATTALTGSWLDLPGLEGLLLSVISLLVGIPLYALMGGVVGVCWASAALGFVIPVVHSALWSLNLRPRLALLGAFTGGLVGFVSWIPLCYFFFRDAISTNLDERMIVTACGPCLAIILGQFGGAWSGSRVKWYDQEIAAAQIESTGDTTTSASQSACDESPQQLQFSIRQLLWICLWVSMLLMLIRLSGIPFHVALPLLLGWLLFQSLTMWLGRRLVRRLGPWWARRRQGRST